MINWAGYILIGWLILSLGIHLAKNGEQRENKYSFGLAFIIAIVEITLFYFAGVF